jgi:hypothetical protein
VQYKDFVLQGLHRGDVKDKTEFLANLMITNAGIVAAGEAAGLDLMSWLNFSSLHYTGGPYAGAVADLYKATSGSDAEKQMARHNLMFLAPTLSDPRSIFVPGSYLAHDIMSAFEEQDDPLNMMLRASGIRTMETRDPLFTSPLY